MKWRIVIWISTLAQDRMLSGPEETAAFMEGQVTDQFELTMGAISISSSMWPHQRGDRRDRLANQYRDLELS